MADKETKVPWEKERASAVQSVEAGKHGGKVPPHNYAIGAQSNADKREAQQKKEAGQ